METSNEYTFIHTVFFWLKEGTTTEEKLQFEEGLRKLGTVKTIVRYHIGVPSQSEREVVDDSFDYAWIVHFRSAADEEIYQTDPIHLEFIGNHQSIWEKVIVYDSRLLP